MNPSILHLLRFFSLRNAALHPARVGLSAVAVALGVALYVSSDTSNYSAEKAFQFSNERLRGEAQLQVMRGRNVAMDESAIPLVDAVAGVRGAPIIQVGATMPDFHGAGTMTILGLDLKRESGFRRWEVASAASADPGAASSSAPNAKPSINALAFAFGDAIIITRTFAAARALELGAKFRIDTPEGAKQVVVGAILEDKGAAEALGGAVAVMEIRSVQRLFGMKGKVDRIDVVVEDKPGDKPGDKAESAGATDAAVKAAQARLAAALGPGYLVEPPPSSNAMMDDAMARVKAFMGISMVAVLVAIFIIYNSVSISVVERVREIGTLRAMGATRGQIFTVIVLEWLLVGLVGSALGLAGGYALASALLHWTVKEINNMTPLIVLREVTIPTRAIIGGAALGMLTTMAASILPAAQAMRFAPVQILRQGIYRMRMTGDYKRLFWVGAALVAVSVVGWFDWLRYPNVGLGSALLGFLGDALMLPQVTIWISRAARPLLRGHRIEAFLAADNAAKFPQRTALTVIALAGSLGMVVSASSLVLSFETRGEAWLRRALPFDLSLVPHDMETSIYTPATFPESLVDEMNAVEGVNFSYGVRAALEDFNGKTIMLVALNLDKYNEAHTLRGAPFIPAERMPHLLSGEGVAVSENFLTIHRLKAGQTITLATPHGPKPFKILAGIEDYSWPQGTIFMNRAAYKALWEDTSISYLDIIFKKGVDKAATRANVEDKIRGRQTLFLRDVNSLVAVANKTLDQTLMFTNVQVMVAVVIGFLGVVNTLLISVLQRVREIGLLRVIGMTRRQIAAIVAIESVSLSLLAALLGVAIGLIGAQGPLSYHVFQVSGFRMPMSVPWRLIAWAIPVSAVFGLLGGIIPARYAARINLLEAIGYE